MRLHEYEAKRLFEAGGIPIPKGEIAWSPERAVEIAGAVGFPVAMKAQVLVGGRGRSGGIQFGENPEEVRRGAEEILGAEIRGYRTEAVLVEEKLTVERELYVGVTVDGAVGMPVLMASSEGGVAVEETVAKHPERIASLHADVFKGVQPYQVRGLAKSLGLNGKEVIRVADLLGRLCRVFMDYDGLISEINPLVMTEGGAFVAADAVLEIDDAALHRHAHLREGALERISDELEREARKVGVSYVNLDGDVGVICSGAGLGMASIDMIRARAEPANFLETGGGITAELMAGALRVVLKKPNLRAVFLNLYGGINPIHEGAKGIIQVIQEEDVKIPVVAKALGNFQEETWAILESAGVKVVKEVQTDKAVQVLFEMIGV